MINRIIDFLFSYTFLSRATCTVCGALTCFFICLFHAAGILDPINFAVFTFLLATFITGALPE